ncbi:MAG: hypothetical protein BGO43_01185 [Gammaproteobacteria bacterium 39-13]|nr:MAG: hypothetical protein BGO43_01185 [Gammaproteobacteria bacterium 39-13]
MFILTPTARLKVLKLLPHRVINNSDDETNFLLISSLGQVEEKILENKNKHCATDCCTMLIKSKTSLIVMNV